MFVRFLSALIMDTKNIVSTNPATNISAMNIGIIIQKPSAYSDKNTIKPENIE